MADRTRPAVRHDACLRAHDRLVEGVTAIGRALADVEAARTYADRVDAWRDLETAFRAASIDAANAAMHARAGRDALTPEPCHRAPEPKRAADLALVGGLDTETGRTG